VPCAVHRITHRPVQLCGCLLASCPVRLHPPAGPTALLRVAPSCALYRAGDDSADCSALPVHLAVPVDRTPGHPNALRSSTLPAADLLRVTPLPTGCRASPMKSCGLPRLPHRSGFAGDGAIGFPIVRIHSAVPIDRPPSCPGLGPSVSPMIRCQVAPRFGSSGSGWCILRVASGRAFRFCQWLDCRISPDRSPLVSPSKGTCGLPRLFRSAGGAVRPIPSCPDSGVMALASEPRLQVSPDRLPFGFPSLPLRVAPLGLRRLGQ